MLAIAALVLLVLGYLNTIGASYAARRGRPGMALARIGLGLALHLVSLACAYAYGAAS